MMTRAQRIHAVLTEHFAPDHLVIADESASHAGHSGARDGGETHYRVELTAEAFRGKSRVEAHRLVNAVLASEFTTGLHALALTAKAPA